ncbi:EscU/YscU/HrcU family type III secretion system export apparatus switch protein [Pimelobacter simplex]|uniref:EscU/YscU/HrcU family type III secretion system export apparatus switch protein n=1 Tax=Nocardioides simplex TaxID=2045 RepID=UPI00214F6D35|nr:EscU/YscU/HrcU family type III secretion system export apparatus switch protein [Pimelobacter simplex]UUW91927.1 EscU/YscU/HrcU family type III secretion system export apparatus switch protein [Pimelobacter simplex]UUW95754.1 EscU/YscU/HrcU family type III secretion system export apparatus switch protein [Pimelobacter simplex]
MAASSEEKTEKPTPKKKKEARKEGQVPRTPELGGWLGLLVVALALGPLMDHELNAVRTLMATNLRAAERPSIPLALHLLGQAGQHILVSLVVLGAMVMVIGVVSALAQGGFYLAPKLAKPDAKKLNPLQGAKRLLGPHAAWEGVKVLVKSSVVAFLAWGAVKSMMPLVGGLLPIELVLHELTAEVSRLVLTVAIAGLVMAAADYAMMKRRIGKQIRMSHSEIKQEHKQAEGDPLVKSAIRSRQLAAARNRMISDVGTADVLLVNPTHVAVALRYDPDRGAPRVVARGAGAIAAKIRERAAEERVPLVQDVPLARALYRHCQVGQEIPRELWAAVAQVLAFVLSRRHAGQHGGEHRTPRRTDELPEVLAGARRRRAQST